MTVISGFAGVRGLMDDRHTGLLCRADVNCRVVFQVRHDESPAGAAVLRDAHELTHGGYVHIPVLLRSWKFGEKPIRRPK